MSENLYHKLLDVNPEVYSPDYYQLLLIDGNNPSPALIESQYKKQMSKVQNVRSTKYKDFVEFLKGELKQARRIINDQKLCIKYVESRKEKSSKRLGDIVEMFIQISGNLSEIEIREIHRRGTNFNLQRRDIDRIIDENLHALGCKRTRASHEQLKRASDIMNRRAELGIVSKSQLLYLTENGLTTRKPDESVKKKKETDVKEANQLKKDALKLNQLAERKKRLIPFFIFTKVLNILVNVVGWVLIIGLLFIILFMKNNPMVKDGVSAVFDLEPETIYVNKPLVDVNKPTKTMLDEFKESFVNPDKTVDYHTRIKSARTQLIELCDKLEGNKDFEQKSKAIDFYHNIVAPSYYNTQTKWDWKMFLKPIDFARYVDFYPENYAEFAATDTELLIPFGGYFTTGMINVSGSFTDSNCNFGLNLHTNSKSAFKKIILYTDENGDYFIKSIPGDKKNINIENILRGKKIDTSFPLAEFTLQLDARTSMNKDNRSVIQLNYLLITSDIKGNKVQTPLFDEIPSVEKEGSRLALFVGKDSKIRIKRILVEPYN
ncbi:MAG: hypothetical protein K8S87_06995 [Planctomycetes bacterium]|nr:hypothetical protein [Planctomycetota bacterium]